MSADQFGVLARKLQPYRGTLSLSCSYEPFVHPEPEALLRQCEVMPGFEIRLNSNGIAMHERVQVALLESTVQRVIISMDAVSPALNQIIRGNNKQEQIIANVRSFMNLRRTRGQKLPLFYLRMTLHELNLSELLDLVRLAIELGVDRLDVQLMAPVAGAVMQGRPVETLLLDTSSAQVQEVFMKAQSMAAGTSLAIGLPVIRKLSQPAEHLWAEKKTPGVSREGFHILSSGKCNASVYNVDVTGAAINKGCGDIFTDSVETILSTSHRLRFPGENNVTHGSVP